MSYSTGMINKRVTILTRGAAQDTDYGRVAGAWTRGATLWAAVDWSRGAKAMREGAMEAYDTIMVRCRWREDLTRESRLLYAGDVYEIESFHADKTANTIQLTAHELPGETAPVSAASSADE